MNMKQKIIYLRDIERSASDIIEEGQLAVDDAISVLGRIIDRNNNPEVITSCETLIEVLNEGPQIREINRLTEEQSRFASKLLLAVRDCLTLTV